MLLPKTSLPFAVLGLSIAALSAGCDTDGMLDVPDAGLQRPPDTILRAVDWPTDARRGPVIVTVDLIDPDDGVTGVRMERKAGGAWTAASTLWHEREGDRLRWAWDSFADQAFDGQADVRFVATDPEDGDATLELSLELRNEPDVDRLVLVSHPYAADFSANDEVGVWVWDGLSPGLLATSRRIQVGVRPGVIRAAPHGRAAAVNITEFQKRVIDIVRTPLDALVDEVQVTHSLKIPHSEAAAFAWSHDGRYLWVAGGLSNHPPLPPVLWRYEPSEDLSVWTEPVAVAELPGPPGALAVDPITGRVLVHCGSGGPGGIDKLVLYDRDGAEVGRLMEDLGATQGLAISSDGQRALWTPNPYSAYAGTVLLLSLESGVQRVGEPAELANAFEPLFHPDPRSHAALISSSESNLVTPVLAKADGLSVGGPITGLLFASEMDRIERGSQSGTFLIPVTSSPTTLRAVMLNTDGSAHRIDVSVPLGGEGESMSGGIAIQR